MSVRWRWTVALLVVLAVVLTAAERHGRSSRRPFVPPADFRPGRWGMVGNAADAFRVWRAAGVSGRRVVVLSGRWSRPRKVSEANTPHPLVAAGDPATEMIDADNALYAAAEIGIARRFEVAMPPAAFERRLAEGREQPDFVLEPDGRAFALPYHGLSRRFSVPGRLDSSTEPSLVLVEPSFFQPGGVSPQVLLEARGIPFDLALVALEDPASDDAQRAAAQKFAERAGAYWLETDE